MAKSKNQDDRPDGEAAIMERMNEALKRMMNMPPETHEETSGDGKAKGGSK